MASAYKQVRISLSHHVATPVEKRLRNRERSDSQLRKQALGAISTQLKSEYDTIMKNTKNLRKYMNQAIDKNDVLQIGQLRKYIRMDLREVFTLRQRLKEVYKELPERQTGPMITRLTILKGVLSRLVSISDIYQYVLKYRQEVDTALNPNAPYITNDFYKNYEGSDEEPYNSDIEIPPVVHSTDFTFNDNFQPDDNFATHQDSYPITANGDQDDLAQQYDHDPAKTPPRTSTVAGRKRAAQDVHHGMPKNPRVDNNGTAQTAHHADDEIPTSPRITSRMPDNVRRKLSFDQQRRQFAEVESTNNGSRLPKFIGPTATAERLARALQKATGVSDNTDIRDALLDFMDTVDEKVSHITPQKSYVDAALPKGFHGPKRTDFDTAKIDFWKHFKSVDLDKFSGQADKKPFASWWQLFDHEINKLPEPFSSDTLKMRALYKLLEGEAQDLVRPFHNSIQTTSYINAVKMLQSRYGSSKKTKEHVKDQMRQLKPASSKCTAQAEFANKILEIRADLEVAGETLREASKQCIEIALRKMSTKYTERYYISLGLRTKDERETFYEGDPVNHLESLVFWINNLKAENYSSDEEEEKSKPIEDSTVTAFATMHDKKSPPPKPKSVKSFRCPICRTDEHPWARCEVPPQERRLKVKERGWCSNCLREGHTNKDCPSEITCYHCMTEGKWMRHHTCLCYSLDNMSAKAKERPIDWRLYKSKKRETGPQSRDSGKKSDRYAKYQKFRREAKRLPSKYRSVFSTLLDLDNSDESSESSDGASDSDSKSDHEKPPKETKEKTKEKSPKDKPTTEKNNKKQ